MKLLAVLAVGALGGWLAAGYYYNERPLTSSVQQQYISSEGELIAKIAKEVGQSVVSVSVVGQSVSQDIFGFGRAVERQSAGTGFIIDENGTVITNRHVVPAGTSRVSITLSDGTRLDDVEVIGRTNDNDSLDIAFLRIKDAKGKKLTPVKIGDSGKVEVGYKVVAIGNALGQFQNSVTSGIISGYGRDVVAGGESGEEALTNLFQTDAAINQGNSGGPLVNFSGEVIGVNTAVAAGGAENIGFAIPIDDVKGLISSVREKGKLEKPYLGVRYVSLSDAYAYEYNLDVKRGAYLLPSSAAGSPSIVPGSPAEKAGLKEKDIIVKINEIALNERTNLSSALSRFKVGETVQLSVVRDGKEITLPATLEALPQQ